jgi:hypothetical protein
LTKAIFPPIPVTPHPLAICWFVINVNDYASEFLTVNGTSMLPNTADILRLVSDPVELNCKLENGVNEQVFWNGATVVELMRKEYLESPTSLPHKSSFP